MQRIEIMQKEKDSRGINLIKAIEEMGFNIDSVKIADNYTIDNDILSEKDKDLINRRNNNIADSLLNPVTEVSTLNYPIQLGDFDYAIEISFHPGVTDNVGNTVTEQIREMLGIEYDQQMAFYSKTIFVKGQICENDAKKIGNQLANPLIEKVDIMDANQYQKRKIFKIPRVKLDIKPKVDIVDIFNASEQELIDIGKKGIKNADETRRGPLALRIEYMHAIKDYFLQQGRNPTDIEVEMLAQTWSEHCKHTIFADQLDDITEGLFKRYIKGSTEKIRQSKGNKDICVSIFTDNSGAIIFDGKYMIAHKVETHNSPSALDPFGGSITGIVGVNRDAIGFGLGAMPIANVWGFCFADPNDKSPLYKGENFTQEMLSSRRILNGVIAGVNSGGNQSGINSAHGFMLFNYGFKGKPNVFVGTLSLMPYESAGRKSHEKAAQHGDYIVMVGGRVGQDGIHGATFSSEAMDSGSPATAVQIGDPITQKKLSDAIVKEARDLGLYTSITDNGAGGLSCSVAEMAKESGGCYVKLEKVPLKYPGLDPWQTWISESQERMTLSVPKDKWNEFYDLMKRRGVEATVIGEFTDSGKCIVEYEGKNCVDLDMEFLHDGLPPRPLTSKALKNKHFEPNIYSPERLDDQLLRMLLRLNIASKEFIYKQYEHEVQGGSVLKPLQGKGRVDSNTTALRPLLDSDKGVILSQGINPTYSFIDTYDMAACAIDTAIRNAVAAGANLDHLALLDNFCWCSSNDPEKLYELEKAVRACHDYSIEYETPFVSGKDSMFNDFKGYDENGYPIKISIPPTLLISSFGVIDDVKKVVSIDAKCQGDLVYLLGTTNVELGGSEYYEMRGEYERGEAYIGNNVPKVDAKTNKKLYKSYFNAVQEGLIASAISVEKGGLGVALAKTAMAGKLGIEISIRNIAGEENKYNDILFSESQGRILITISPENKERFEEIMQGNVYTKIGEVKGDSLLITGASHETSIDTKVSDLLESYKSTFRGY